jgi:hypothetical protein
MSSPTARGGRSPTSRLGRCPRPYARHNGHAVVGRRRMLDLWDSSGAPSMIPAPWPKSTLWSNVAVGFSGSVARTLQAYSSTPARCRALRSAGARPIGDGRERDHAGPHPGSRHRRLAVMKGPGSGDDRSGVWGKRHERAVGQARRPRELSGDGDAQRRADWDGDPVRRQAGGTRRRPAGWGAAGDGAPPPVGAARDLGSGCSGSRPCAAGVGPALPRWADGEGEPAGPVNRDGIELRGSG